MKVEAKAEPKIEEQTPLETEVLPDVEEPIETPASEDLSKKLELENAELRGRISAFESIATKNNQPQAQQQADAWKQVAYNDINTLEDEEFEAKYKNKKHQVSSAILEFELKNQTTQTRQEIAELKAENQIVSKYPDYHKHKAAINEALADASTEVKQDPERLARFMERTYLAIAKENPAPKKKEESVERRNIQSNFEKPSPKGSTNSGKSVENDEIPSEFAPICHAFGIKSEKERKAFMESDEIETEFGNGIVFRRAEKGFEKVR
jgi:hypothetical protein